MKDGDQPEYRQSPHLVQQNLTIPEKNPILPMFGSGNALRKKWDAASIAPILLPLQDRTKNSCCVCSHIIAIMMVSALSSGQVPLEETINHFLEEQGFRRAFNDKEVHKGPQGRNVFKRGKVWQYPQPRNVVSNGKKRSFCGDAPMAKRIKLEKNTEQK